MKNITAVIDSPDKNSSLLYKSGFYCIDPFILIDDGTETSAWLPSTEIEKAKYKSNLQFIILISNFCL